MKKLLVVLAILGLAGCSNYNHGANETVSDSTLVEVDTGHISIYDVTTGTDVIMEVCHEIEDGTIKITASGDTLYWLGGDTTGTGKYISSDEWSDYSKMMNELHKQ